MSVGRSVLFLHLCLVLSSSLLPSLFWSVVHPAGRGRRLSSCRKNNRNPSPRKEERRRRIDDEKRRKEEEEEEEEDQEHP